MTGTREVPLPVVEGGPETLFRVGQVRAEGDVVLGTMPTGPWLAGADGRPTLGALGVLVDNVLGYAIIARRPPEHWSVSTEISLDLLEPLPLDGTALHASARVIHADAVGGFALGEVHDEAGRLVATCRQRGRFVPAAGDPGPAPYEAGTGGDAENLQALLGVPSRTDGLEVEVTGFLQNPMRNLHGGITLCLADLAASAVLEDSGPSLDIASIQMTYVRGVPGGTTVAVDTDVQHRGRTLASVEVVVSTGGRACTIGRVTAQPRPA